MAPMPAPEAYWDDLTHHVAVEEIWMGHPAARARINRRVSGDPAIWPTTWLKHRLGARAPLARTASLGSGTGNLERDLVRQGIVARVTGVELSATCVEEARRLADAEGFASRIDYESADARAWLEEARGYDAIFFHGSLHHFDRLPALFAAVARALAPGGLLWFDEYVGPAADEWGPRHLLLWNLIYRLRLPPAARRARLVRAPRNDADPTESVASSAILPALEHHFRVLERRDYGGQLLTPIYPYLRRPDHRPPALREVFDHAVERLLDLEEVMLAHPGYPDCATHYCVVLATPRPAPEPAGRS
ncbi:MAG: class I SAM-dependent methyltransferase [Thermoanaerobaculia bacterium]|nr:MAG: class I SAM-dependent methyltransferase [Thermoanaerobaculia bacterium]